MSYSDVEHYATMLSGCEALSNGNYRSPNAIYATTVLKLHAGDAGLVAGQEGFLDHVKRGTQTLKKWFLALLDVIGKFIDKVSGTTRKQEARANETKRQIEERKKKEADEEGFQERINQMTIDTFAAANQRSKRVYDDINDTGYLDKYAFTQMDIKVFHVGGGHSAINDLIYITSNPDSWVGRDVLRDIDILAKAIGHLEYDAKRSVSKWADETTIAAEREDIKVASYLLTKFTEVLDWYTKAYEIFARKSEEMIKQNKGD